MPLNESTTMIPAWIVCAWPPILWQASRAPQLRLQHCGTRVLTFRDGDTPSAGQTLWADAGDPQAAGVAWDWVEIESGVVAMADPFGLVTNLHLVDDDGEPLNDVAAAIRLQEVLHGLPWQAAVERALHPAAAALA